MAGRQAGFFDVAERLQRLSDLGDQLEAYARTVDFELFRSELEAALAYADGAKGGRPPFDPVMMFKILVIQAQNNLSNERAKVPDQLMVSKTINPIRVPSMFDSLEVEVLYPARRPIIRPLEGTRPAGRGGKALCSRFGGCAGKAVGLTSGGLCRASTSGLSPSQGG